MCVSPTPFEVQMNSNIAQIVGAHVAMLCCRTPNSFIMSKRPTTSASVFEGASMRCSQTSQDFSSEDGALQNVRTPVLRASKICRRMRPQVVTRPSIQFL